MAKSMAQLLNEEPLNGLYAKQSATLGGVISATKGIIEQMRKDIDTMHKKVPL